VRFFACGSPEISPSWSEPPVCRECMAQVMVYMGIPTGLEA
jgi:hypothetical protein